MDTLREAIGNFADLYEEKTGNAWELRGYFQKVPGKFCPIEIDYGEEEATGKLQISDGPSKLPAQVQDLIRLIFDVNNMKKVMLEFELDTEKMPLGKLSKSQIQKAFGVLSDLQDVVRSGGPRARLIEASNRFYTYIPHSFGVDDPPVIDSEEMVKVREVSVIFVFGFFLILTKMKYFIMTTFSLFLVD